MIITMIAVESEPEARKINDLYPDGSIIAVPIFRSVPNVRVDRIIINRAAQSPAWREAVGGDRYDRWERECLLHRLAPGREREGLILL
jgi:hypothetical protein